MYDLNLTIAGVRLRLRGEDSAIRRAARRSAPYAGNGNAELILHWREGDPPKSRAWPDPNVTVKPRGGRIISRKDFFCDMGPRIGTLVTSPDALSLDSFLRVLLSEILVKRGGLLVHAAAVGRRFFPGASGSGKSTLASIAPRRRVLSDELVAVIQAPHGFELCGTPFWGSFVRGVNVDQEALRAVYFLERGRKEILEHLPPAEAVSRLLGCVLCFVDDEAGTRRILQTAIRIARSVPCARLSFDVKKTSYKKLVKRLELAERTG